MATLIYFAPAVKIIDKLFEGYFTSLINDDDAERILRVH